MALPYYWMDDTSSWLRSAVLAYLRGRPMSDEQIAAMREYLRQWIASTLWDWSGDRVAKLRAGIDGLTTREAIDAWLAQAEKEGILDPI